MNYRGELLWINGALWWMTNLVRVRCITGGLCAYGGQQWIMACIMVDIASESGALWVRLWSTMVNCVAFRCILWYSIYTDLIGQFVTNWQTVIETNHPTNKLFSIWIMCVTLLDYLWSTLSSTLDIYVKICSSSVVSLLDYLDLLLTVS